jgi:5-methylcytosine-specific restriction endonuclease McrA
MNFKILSNTELLKLAIEKSQGERELSLEVIKLLREVESRRLFLELGFGSMFDYATKELGYEESAANRRISASRLIREIPEAEEKIREGKLTLSNIVQAQVFFRNEEKIHKTKPTPEQKREVLSLLENKSTRAAQKALFELSPQQVNLKEVVKQVTSCHTEVKLVIGEDLREKLEKLKLLLSHKNPKMNYSELIEELASIALKKLNPIHTKIAETGETKADLPTKNKSFERHTKTTGHIGNAAHLPSAPAVQKVTDAQTRYIPAEVKRSVWQRDQGQCSFVDPATKRKCGSQFRLEVHHERPYAKGGANTPENLRLLCKNHNLHKAIDNFGKAKMRCFIPDLIPV